MAPRAGAAAVSAIALDEIGNHGVTISARQLLPGMRSPFWGSERTKFAHFEHPDANSDDAQDGKDGGVFHTEGAGGAPKQVDEEHQPSCFALEEEKGGNWKGSGGAGPAVNESRPRL